MVRQRRLGDGNRYLPSVGLGCMGMDFAYTDDRDRTGEDVIRRALELGANHLDTSDLYGPFTNEERVGRAIADRREQVMLATKCGLVVRAGSSYDIVANGRPEHIRASCEGSLRRLGVEQIDLYYLHRVDPSVPVEESVGALGELVAEGKIAAIGISEAKVDVLERAHSVHPLAALQSELSLWTRAALNGPLQWCAANGVTFVAYSPLSRGQLAGRHQNLDELPADDFRRRLPRFSEEAFEANAGIAEEVDRVARARGVAAAQIALAWVLAQGDHVVAIPGTKRISHLEANVAADEINLTTGELETLTGLSPALGSAR